MKWLMILAITIINNDGAFKPKTYELMAYTDFAMCSMAKADIDYILKTPTHTTVVKGDCFTEGQYKEFLNRNTQDKLKRLDESGRQPQLKQQNKIIVPQSPPRPDQEINIPYISPEELKGRIPLFKVPAK